MKTRRQPFDDTMLNLESENILIEQAQIKIDDTKIQ